MAKSSSYCFKCSCYLFILVITPFGNIGYFSKCFFKTNSLAAILFYDFYASIANRSKSIISRKDPKILDASTTMNGD